MAMLVIIGTLREFRRRFLTRSITLADAVSGSVASLGITVGAGGIFASDSDARKLCRLGSIPLFPISPGGVTETVGNTGDGESGTQRGDLPSIGASGFAGSTNCNGTSSGSSAAGEGTAIINRAPHFGHFTFLPAKRASGSFKVTPHEEHAIKTLAMRQPFQNRNEIILNSTDSRWSQHLRQGRVANQESRGRFRRGRR